MDWEAIGAIGQMLGSVAVIVTLGYLATQVRHARNEVRRSISQNRADAIRQLMTDQANNERLAALMVKGHTALGGQPGPFAKALMERTGMTYEEAQLVGSNQVAWWHFCAQVIPYIGQMRDGERSAFDDSVRAFYGTQPIGALYYQEQKAGLDPEVVHYIDNLLAQPG